MKVTIFDYQKGLKIYKRAITKMVKALLSYLSVDCHEIIFDFVNEKEIRELHEEFFNDPSPTDCITFPIDEEATIGNRILGEIFICTDTAIKYAKEHNIDPYEETYLYIVHGILHLIGFDDIREKDRILMKKKEKQCMDFLKKENLIKK